MTSVLDVTLDSEEDDTEVEFSAVLAASWVSAVSAAACVSVALEVLAASSELPVV